MDEVAFDMASLTGDVVTIKKIAVTAPDGTPGFEGGAAPGAAADKPPGRLVIQYAPSRVRGGDILHRHPQALENRDLGVRAASGRRGAGGARRGTGSAGGRSRGGRRCGRPGAGAG